MLKLIKYDFRRNREQILGLYAVTLLLQAVIWISAEVYHWEKLNMFVLQVVTYVSAAIFLVVLACRTYNFNLKSYGRKLLPVKTLYTVLSPLLLNLVLVVALVALAVLHAALYDWVYPDTLHSQFWNIVFITLLNIIGIVIMTVISLMFSITVAQSLSFRSKVWIGIITLFILNVIVVTIEGRLFSGSSGWMDFHYDVTAGNSVSTENMELSLNAFDVGPVLFETAVCVILLYVSALLVKKKVEL